MDVSDERLVEAGWTIVNGALRTFVELLAAGGAGRQRRGAARARADPGRRRHHAAGADRDRLQRTCPRVQTDESTLITRFVTAMVEAHGAKGSGWSATHAARALHRRGRREAARQAAIDAIGGERVPSGRLHGRLRPPAGGRPHEQPHRARLPRGGVLRLRARRSSAGSAGAVASPRAVASTTTARCRAWWAPRASPARACPPAAPISSVTGVLVGLSGQLVRAPSGCCAIPRCADKLGADRPAAAARARRRATASASAPAADGSSTARPSASASNVVVEGAEPVSLEELLRAVGDGLYIGRIWYTYPINGLRAGDFTCTVVGDSYIIRDGRIAAPLRANAIRINDNIATLPQQRRRRAPRTPRAPSCGRPTRSCTPPRSRSSGVRVDEIAGSMEELRLDG